MASTTHDPRKTVPESGSSAADTPPFNLFPIDFGLRALLFAATLIGIIVMVTGNQTEKVTVPILMVQVSSSAKFKNSPALIYHVVVLAVACFYSIITILVSLSAMTKRSVSNKLLLLLASIDAFLAALVGSATGASASVAYIGLKGNSHTMWNKICDPFDKFCQHVGGSVAMGILGSVVLVFLVILSTYSLYRRSH